MSNPTILLIPASFTLPGLYDNLRHDLAARGVDLFVAPLTSVATRNPSPDDPSPAPGMYADASIIEATASRLCDGEGRDVVVVAHSYGGVPLSQAHLRPLAKTEERSRRGLRGGILGLAYISAVVPPEGKSAGEFTAAQQEMGRGAGPENQISIGMSETGWLYMEDCAQAARVAFSSLPADEGQKWVSDCFGRHSALAFGEPLVRPRWADWANEDGGSVSYLLCEADMCVVPATQLAGIDSIEAAGCRVAVKRLEGADHMPMVSRTKETADWLVRLATGST